MTDAMRAEYLEGQGYDAQILEFIDMEHTPKKYPDSCGEEWQSKKRMGRNWRPASSFLNIAPTLKKLLEEKEV